eukprot:Polyplicarium_translucidae@DN635_c0_g1_i2.p1
MVVQSPLGDGSPSAFEASFWDIPADIAPQWAAARRYAMRCESGLPALKRHADAALEISSRIKPWAVSPRCRRLCALIPSAVDRILRTAIDEGSPECCASLLDALLSRVGAIRLPLPGAVEAVLRESSWMFHAVAERYPEKYFALSDTILGQLLNGPSGRSGLQIASVICGATVLAFQRSRDPATHAEFFPSYLVAIAQKAQDAVAKTDASAEEEGFTAGFLIRVAHSALAGALALPAMAPVVVTTMRSQVMQSLIESRFRQKARVLIAFDEALRQLLSSCTVSSLLGFG